MVDGIPLTGMRTDLVKGIFQFFDNLRIKYYSLIPRIEERGEGRVGSVEISEVEETGIIEWKNYNYDYDLYWEIITSPSSPSPRDSVYLGDGDGGNDPKVKLRNLTIKFARECREGDNTTINSLMAFGANEFN